ncbi:MAG: flagellar motor protein MotB [Candidatus Sulfotelmatobacter sp.]
MDKSRPIIIIKKKGGHGGHHGGAWKVAYADFVTTMMSLFIVLWLLSSSKPVQEAVGGCFRDPSGTAEKKGTINVGAGENFILTKDDMPKLKDQLEQKIREMNDFEKLKSHVEMTITSEGLRIELMESASGTFFDSGSPKLNADARDLLITLAQELSKLPNKISLEGHTDSKPYATAGNYSNWELSTDRANAARRLMQANGIGPGQITQVRGFADQRLRKPADPLDPSNRRVSLIVQYTPKDTDQEAAKPAAAVEEKKPAGAASAKPPAGTEKPSDKTLPLDPEKKGPLKKEPEKTQ